MAYQGLDLHGTASIRGGQDLQNVDVLIERGEFLDRTLGPTLLHYAQPVSDLGPAYPAIGATGLNGHYFRQWLCYIPRTTAAVGSLRLQARARYVTGPTGNIHVVFLASDLTTVLATVTLPVTSAANAKHTVSFVQPENPDTWFVAQVYLEDVDTEWIRVFAAEDTDTPEVAL